jgi:hypothetical protein
MKAIKYTKKKSPSRRMLKYTTKHNSIVSSNAVSTALKSLNSSIWVSLIFVDLSNYSDVYCVYPPTVAKAVVIWPNTVGLLFRGCVSEGFYLLRGLCGFSTNSRDSKLERDASIKFI